MPSPVRFAIVRRMLEEAGWSLARIAGSHHVFTKPGRRSYPLPVHRGKVNPEYVRAVEKLIENDAADEHSGGA